MPVEKQDPVASGRLTISYIDIGAISGGRIATPSVITAESAPTRARQVVKSGDTLFSTVRPYLRNIAIVPPELDGEFASTGFCVLRPGTEIDSRYLFHFMQSEIALDQILPRQRGVSYPAVRDQDVLGVEFDLPDLSEQQHVVDILEYHLSRLEAAGQSLSSADRRRESLEAAATARLLNSNDVGRLADVVGRIEAGKSFGGASRRADVDEWGIIKVSAMTSGEYREDQNKWIESDLADPRFEIHPGDVLLSRANTTEYVGASVLVHSTRPHLLLSDKSLRLIPKPGVDPRWLQIVLASQDCRRQISTRSTGTKESMRNISQASLLNIVVPLHDAGQQAQVVAAASELRQSLDMLRRSIGDGQGRLFALRSSLLRAAFSRQLTGRESDSNRTEEMAYASHDSR
jgi:type I restriction enzyme S subunit